MVFARGLNGIIQQNVASPVRNFFVAGEIDHVSNQTNNWSIRYSFQGRTSRNQGVGGTVLSESGTDSHFREHEINLAHQKIFSPKLVNEFRIFLGHFDSPTVSLRREPRIVVLDAFTGGGAQNDQLFTEYHFGLTDILSYSSGKHLIKTGVNIPDWSRRGADFNVNFGGSFYFSSLDDYRKSLPFSFTLQQGNPHLVFVEKVVGGFIQDEYHPRPNLLLAAGLRYDWQSYFHDRNNFAPRLSVAFSPDKNQKTVIRGGAGVFYDRTGPGPILETLLFNGTRIKRFVIENPAFPDPFGNGLPLSTQPVSRMRLDPKIKIPYVFQYSLGLEHQLQKSTTVSINYIGSRGISLFRSLDINAPLPPDYVTRPDPSLGVVREIESAGRSQRDSLEISVRGTIARYFKGLAQYRLSRNNNNTAGIGYFPPNTYDLAGEWARSNEDRRHRFDLLGTVDPGKFFRLGVGLSVYTGAPYTITTGRDDFRTGTANARPFGIPRNSKQGPGYAALDVRWSRDLFLVKGKKEKGPTVTIALDAFNILNRVNLATLVGNLSSPFFGHAIAAQPPRRLQVTARFRF